MQVPTSPSGNVVVNATVKTIPLIDVLRGVSILIVLAGHSRAGLNMPHWSLAQSFWNALTVHMGDGVTIFFVVSGFLITRLIDQAREGFYDPTSNGFTRVGSGALSLCGPWWSCSGFSWFTSPMVPAIGIGIVIDIPALSLTWRFGFRFQPFASIGLRSIGAVSLRSAFTGA